MPIDRLDHVNIRTRDPAATIAFYREVLGMGFHDIMGQGDPSRGGWLLDADGHPAIHVGHANLAYPSDAAEPWRPGAGGAAVHHVALACSDRPAMTARLAAHGCTVSENRVPQVSLVQLFVADPNGILLELNFHEP